MEVEAFAPDGKLKPLCHNGLTDQYSTIYARLLPCRE
jgi:hypothetical protein